MLRTSSYTIFVKLPAQGEDVLLVHGYTGAYDRVSGSVAAFDSMVASSDADSTFL